MQDHSLLSGTNYRRTVITELCIVCSTNMSKLMW